MRPTGLLLLTGTCSPAARIRPANPNAPVERFQMSAGFILPHSATRPWCGRPWCIHLATPSIRQRTGFSIQLKAKTSTWARCQSNPPRLDSPRTSWTRLGHDPDMFIDLGHELFLPGYPLGLSAGGLLPIWKRASLASSLEFRHGINRFFFVDTATREGMSGAPCLATSNWKHYAMDRPTGKVRVVERPLSWRLLGVYSGRRTPSDSFEAQIGIVWRETTIFETITGQTRASVKLRTQA
jgi:hypothetical protein